MMRRPSHAAPTLVAVRLSTLGVCVCLCAGFWVAVAVGVSRLLA
jgi:hypothetical protein